MKQSIIFLITFILTFAGCERPSQYDSLEVIPASIQASKDGWEFAVRIIGPPDWTTDNTADWISIRKKGDTATIEIKKNTGAERSREIGFSSHPFYASLRITQENSDIFRVTPSTSEFSYKGGTARVETECYSHWTAESGCHWISIDKTEGDSPASVTVTAEQSFERHSRFGEVTFRCGDRTNTVIFSQDPSPYIEVEKSMVEIDGDGGDINVLFISNTDVSIATDSEWIRIIETAPSDKTVRLEVSRNLGSRRSGTVAISSLTDIDYFKEITILQGEKIDHPDMYFEEGSILEIQEKGTFILHPVFIDMTDTSLSWDSDRPDIASVDQRGQITVFSGGSCQITATNHFHGISAVITLNIRIIATDMKLMLDRQDMEKNPMAVRYVGELVTVKAVLTPEDAYSEDFVCISSDPEIVKIDGMQIRCLTTGKTTISVESLYQGLNKSFELIILED